MISQILIGQDHDSQTKAALGCLENLNLSRNHPDVLWLDSEEANLGMEAAKEIIDYFTLKPYQAKGRVVVVVGADNLTADAQNSLLKTLEEPPSSAMLILTTNSEESLLPTILSRCQVIRIKNQELGIRREFEVEKILAGSLEERFAQVEKIEDKEGLLNSLLYYFHDKLQKDPRSVEGAKLLLKAEEWQKSNVNARAILEYLMLNL